ncbi:MAG: hypothetical protein ACTTKI_11725 [Tannerella sp.]|uniref:hypothetical protein n=1 Tax=Tannerella sp. TaxID=2382127 RepID=UPI003FA2F4F9
MTNGCPCEGDYVDGLGIAGSDTVQVRSSHPRYPNEKAYAILRDTTFFHTVRLPTITPIVSPSAPAYVHENLMEVLKKIAQPAFTPAAREMANLLLKKCQERKDEQKKAMKDKIKDKEEIKRRAAEKNKPVNLKKSMISMLKSKNSPTKSRNTSRWNTRLAYWQRLIRRIM